MEIAAELGKNTNQMHSSVYTLQPFTAPSSWIILYAHLILISAIYIFVRWLVGICVECGAARWREAHREGRHSMVLNIAVVI